MVVLDPYATDAKRVGGVFYISNQSLRAVADRLDHRVVSTGLVTVAAAVVVVAGVALAGWAFRASSNLLGVLVCAATGLVASPITWAHHMVWAVPVLVWLAWAPDRPAGGRVWAVAGAALFWWAPIWTVPNGGNVGAQRARLAAAAGATRSSWPPWCSWSGWPRCC